MRPRTEAVVNWTVVNVVLILACWILFSAVTARAQKQGQNAVYNPTGSATNSLAFIDAGMFAGNAQNRNLCSVLNYVLANIDQPPTYPNGAVIDARGIPGVTPLVSMTCTASPWAGITNPPPSTILLPATGGTSPNPIIIPSTWALPSNTRLVGEGDGIPSTTSPGTTIQAASGFASGTAMISFGLSSLCTAGCTGISAENLTLDGQGQSINGIGNGFSQSLSYVDHVSLYRILLYT